MKKLACLVVLVIASVIVFLLSFSLKKGSVQTADTKTNTTLPTIIIDAGHGGFDGGAVTDDGYPEKDINLAISLYLNDILNLWGYNTVLTRESDVSLEDDGLETIRQRKKSDIHNRMDIMKDIDNALFISIHQNHYSIERYSGAQVFYSPAFPGEGADLALSIQESIVTLLQPDNKRLIKECDDTVYLIYNAVKPAVLVECGFLSNKNESELLMTDSYRQKIAFCIAVGIQNYIGELYGKK